MTHRWFDTFKQRHLGWLSVCLLVVAVALSRVAHAGEYELKSRAAAAMERAASYFYSELAVQGTYVWSYSVDLSVRRGEGRVEESIGWVQPPGTPAIGAAFLRIYEVTGNETWLRSAQETAAALVSSQLLSGGWAPLIETDTIRRQQWCYRSDGVTREECERINGNELKNRSTIDDNTTQSVLNFLLWLDEAGDGEDVVIRTTIEDGLEALLQTQYQNGAWAIELDRVFPHREITSAWRATLPPAWPHEWVEPEAPPYYVLNDNIVRDTIRLFLSAHQRLGRPELLAAAMRSGDFLLAAQLPAPQRGWAQAYDSDLQPVWGRRFEPPAVASRESAGAIDALLQLYVRTGKARYLEGALEGAAWLNGVRLVDGTWARFYELTTNRPLYVTNDLELTFSDHNLLDHYSLKAAFDIPEVLDLVDRIVAGQPDVARTYWPSPIDQWSESELEGKVRDLVETQDAQGRWIEDGWIQSQTFVDAIFALARYSDSE